MPGFKVIGTRLPRVDGMERVTGRAIYGADFMLQGVIYGKVLRSPYAHARVKVINAQKALDHPDVLAVVTGEDMPVPPEGAVANLGETQIDMDMLREMVLAQEKVLFHGYPVAALAAVTPEAAEEALELIEVEYEPLPVVEDVLQAMAPDAPIIHPDLRTETMGGKGDRPTNVAGHVEFDRGDVEAGFRQADVVVEETFRTDMVHQGYIEPQACTAQVDPDGRLTVWTTTQGSFTVKMQLAALLDLPLSKVKVVPLEIGGGFGGKIYVFLEPLAALLSRKSGRPVKMVMTREEVLRATGPASPAVITVKVGARTDGTITAMGGKLIYDAGCFKGSPVGMAALVGFAGYPAPNIRIDGYDVVTNKPRVNAYRAPGGPPAGFAVESVMDMVAERIGMDPVEFRLKNAAQEGDLLPNNLKFNRIGFREVLERVKRHPGWTAPLTGKNRGRGVAIGYWRGATFTSSCHVTVNADGTISLVLGSVDLTGTRTSLCQIAAEEFQMTPAEVAVQMADTDSAAYTDVTGGSRITYSQSIAVHRACQDALNELKRRAAIRLNARPEEIEYRERWFALAKDPDRKISLKELATASLTSEDGPVIGRGSASRMQPAPAFGAHIADVEVDPETGKVRVLRYTAFQDVGCAVNPTQVEGQIQGGAAQGIGWALTEGYFYDKGILKNPSLLDYRMPTSLDLPLIDVELIEVPASDGPYGVRGVGECPIVPPPGALANAIYRAVGVRMTKLPMTPEEVFWATREKKAEGCRQKAVSSRRKAVG